MMLYPLVEETTKIQRHTERHYQNVLHKGVSKHLALAVISTDCICEYKSNYHTIGAKDVPQKNRTGQ
jgi:hypothetical protein